jgi:P-type Mg2+ transporter
MDPEDLPYWSLPVPDLSRRLETGDHGLCGEDARARLARVGANVLRPRRRAGTAWLLLSQFTSPIVLVLIFAALLASFLGQHIDATIILMIVLGSGLLGFWQERGAVGAVEALQARVRIKATVVRDGQEAEVPVEEVVPGDVIVLGGGDTIPGDGLILESKDLFVDEAALTGESFPVEKAPGLLPEETPLAWRSNSLFLGTHVVSGTARAIVVRSGKETEFNRVSQRMALGRPETEFERGVRHFGYLLMEVTLILVVVIFAINVALARPVLDSLLFSLALAVGLTPQLLPAVVSVNLAHGARRMAERKVIVKRLASIEDFGSMDVLCSDKTGTLTEGVARVHTAIDFQGNPCEKARLYAFLNARYESGFTNPIDEAIRADRPSDPAGYRKLDEVPYDFLRRRLSILVEERGRPLLVTKGALASVLAVCSRADTATGEIMELTEARAEIERRYQELGSEGFRTLGVAYRELDPGTPLTREHEAGMTFAGFLVLHDPPRDHIAETIGKLAGLGVALKIVTGDNRHVARAVAEIVGVPHPDVLTGEEIARMSDRALILRAGAVSVFAEVEPNQKERILLALKKAGNVVGYLGDGINDASALHAADVGISVESAVDVAKDAADIVLMEKGLDVLAEGIREGRVTFANTLKYVYMAASANFGNMISMAGISLVLPYLPLLPKQILLLNLLTDLPEMAIAADRVDPEWVERPRRWEVGTIRRFMVVFGGLSSLFDCATFGLLLLVLRATPIQFRTGWFLESIVSATAIVLVIRTRRAFYASRPGTALSLASLLVMGISLVFPYIAPGRLLGFGPFPVTFLPALGGIVVLYVAAAEAMKRWYYRGPPRAGSGWTSTPRTE